VTTYFRPDSGERGRAWTARQRTAADAKHGRRLPMTTSDPIALGRALRLAMWRFSSRTNTRDPEQRDRMALAVAHQQHRAAAALVPDNAIRATLREPAPGRCSWDAYIALSALDGEPTPTPTPALSGLLGRPCAKCRGVFATQRVAKREHADLAAGGNPRPPATATPPVTIRKAPPPFYGSQRVQPRR
jgi:hypothetical protein